MAHNPGAGELARVELLRDPRRSNGLISDAAGCSPGIVATARRDLQAAGLVPVIDTRDAKVPKRPKEPATAALPRMPDFSAGRCFFHPHSDWWTSDDRNERDLARRACLSCPLLAQCAEWSLSLPNSDAAIYGGMTSSERRVRKSERARTRAEAAAAARLAALSPAARRNAEKAECDHGHKLSGDNLVMLRGRSGWQRGCRTCRRDRKRVYNRVARQVRRARPAITGQPSAPESPSPP
jgi:hypothetical protein